MLSFICVCGYCSTIDFNTQVLFDKGNNYFIQIYNVVRVIACFRLILKYTETAFPLIMLKECLNNILTNAKQHCLAIYYQHNK